jgi:superfamily II DNA or RNA helicase
MGIYPNIKDKEFYKKTNKKFNKFKIKKTNKSYDDWCFPKKYTLQLPQEFLANFVNPNTPYMDLLVYHRIGSGKTCTSIQICEKFKKQKRIIVVVPASLRGNYRNELRSHCTGNTYITEKERDLLSKLDPSDKKYMEIIDKTDERIDEYYEIYSYNKFVELIENGNLNLKNALLVIDEIQNMISEQGTFYWALYNAIKKAPKDLRIILLSATPMFDKPSELALTLNLLRLPKEMPIGKEFNKTFIKMTKKKDGTFSYKMKNIELFKSYIKGYISYYLGAPSFVFPKTIIKQIECEMSDFQYNVYRKVNEYEETYEDDLTNDFYIGTRMISNIAFPNKTLDEKGLEQLTPKIIRKDLEKYSCKFAAIMEKLEHTSGKVFIYSNFKEYGGLASLIKVLEANGYQSYVKNGIGKKRFAIWTGDETDNVKNEIRNVFNRKDNINGSKIRILLGSAAIKQGVSLTSIRQVHILENSWNISAFKQISGRGVRYCSHKELPEHKRSVKIYVYNAVAPYDKNKNGEIQTVDQYMQKLAHSKEKLIMQFETVIRESAIDCSLNYNANIDDGNVEIVCDK